MAIDSLGLTTRSSTTPLQQPAQTREVQESAKNSEDPTPRREATAAQAAAASVPAPREEEAPDRTAPRGSFVNLLV